MEIIGAITMILAVTGVILNNRKLRFCFVMWMLSNFFSGIIHIYTGVISMVIRDFIFFVLAIEGWFKWGRK